MSESVLIGLISASGALIVGLTSVGLNVFWMGKSFDQLRTSIADLRGDINKRLERVDSRLDRVGDDLKQFYRMLSEHSTDIARLKHKSDLN